MHGPLITQDDMRLMASDDPESEVASRNGSFGDAVGILPDRFGIGWMINAVKPRE